MIKIEKGKEFAGLIPNSKIHIIKNCGHMIILENAFEMREKINEFLKKWKLLSQDLEDWEELLLLQD